VTAAKVRAAASGAEEKSAVHVIVLAFGADPMARWSFSDPAVYLEEFPPFVRAFGAPAFANGSADYVDGGAGAALWLPPDTHPDEETMGAIIARACPASIRADVAEVMEQMARHHPDEPHWYLPLIGVDPARQNQGHGSALLRHALARCDRDHLPAYLESTNPRNIPLYERHGFERLARVQVGASPPVVPMLRRAR
jgi:ribosomal protein S18 acetylase RimI-like enzyme